MELMLQRINKQSLIFLAILSIGALLFFDWRIALGVAVGGLIGVVNLRGIVWSVKNLVGEEKAQAKMMVISMFRILVTFSILLILAIFKLINGYGVLAGFTVVVLIIVKEGLAASKRLRNNG